MNYIIVITTTSALFLAIIMALALKTKISAKITQGIVLVAAIGGLLYYGYGYAEVSSNLFMAIVKATLAVCGMFVGKNDWSAISGTELFQSTFAQVLFWIIHLMALFSTASAAIATIGASALRELRLFMIRKGKLVLIYGVNEDSFSLGKELNERKDTSVLYVAEQPPSAIITNIEAMNCIVRSDPDALNVSKAFLKSIGILGLFSKERTIIVYAVDKNISKNTEYAKKCIKQFEANGIQPQNTKLVLHSHDEQIVKSLAAVFQEDSDLPTTYGFGSVYGFNEANLVARLLVHQNPPCKYISFDENALATSDFDAVIIGFGLEGQAVLKQLVMNGQFPGSRFHVAVVAPDCEDVSGYIRHASPELFNQYDIELLPIDARSSDFFTYIAEHKHTLNYMAICTGSAKSNAELASRLVKYTNTIGCKADIFQCYYNGIKLMNREDVSSVNWNIYNKELLAPEKRDHLAMLLNDYYEGNPMTSPQVAWARCSYFNKLSSCAATDCIPAYLHMVAASKETVIKEGLQLTEAQLENLSQAEHLRWNAFHYVNGYKKMPEEIFEKRVEHFKEIEASEGIEKARKYKLSKDEARKLHTCLVSWDELDQVTAAEKAVTGKESLDYKQYDRNNVLLMETLLKAAAKLD